MIQYARNGDVSIAYRVLGDGPLDLVMVPGFVGHLEILFEEPRYVRFVERLASFARVAVYDKREQGLSDRLGRPPTLEESVADLLAVMDAIGMERAALFGVSEGGPMACLFAATHPERTRALALYGTFARMVEAPDHPVGITERTLDGLLARVDDWGGPVGLDLWAPSVADQPQAQRFWARLLRAGSSPRGARDLISLYREIDVRDVLPSIQVPTLVLNRTGDRMVSMAQARDLADRIPGARLVELPGDDHLYVTGDVDALLEEIEEHFTGARGVAPVDRALKTVLFTDMVDSTARAARLGDRRWRWSASSSPATAVGRSRRSATASWPPSTARRPAFAARGRSSTAPPAWASTFAPACTPASASWSVTTCAAWRSTSARASARWPGRARCWCRAPSATWWSGRDSSSPIAASTSSRACPARGGSSPLGSYRRQTLATRVLAQPS
jgi:pimeloyl-ACP methyl ester carboxylesterase